MKRKAVLIEAAELKGHNDLPGARRDVVNYRQYLSSAFGGAWDESTEIDTFTKPGKKFLLEYIRYLSTYDYTIITFSGHGHHVTGRGLDESRICLNDTEELAVRDLYPNNPKSLIIADSCREVTVLEEEERKSVLETLASKTAARHPNRANCRALFEEAIELAPPGPLYMYSCNIGEVAAESNTRGGYFSRALIDVANEWSDRQSRPAALRTDEAFALACKLTTASNSGQHPQYEGSTRRNTHFPHAVFAW